LGYPGAGGMVRPRNLLTMPWQDDDDWVGEPPEGRHSRDRAKPEFWATQRPLGLTAAAIGIVAIILLIVILLG